MKDCLSKMSKHELEALLNIKSVEKVELNELLRKIHLEISHRKYKKHD